MTTGSVERMRELVAAFNDRDPGKSAAVLDEYVVFDARQLMVPELQRVYQGRAGVADFWHQWLPMWESVTSEILWIEEIGDHVLMWLRQTQVGREAALR